MADFSIAVASLLQREGGFVNHPADRGGPTKYGISQRSYPDVDMAALTEDEARALYRRDFWEDAFDKIPSQQLADKLLDSAVHLGKAKAVRVLQEALGEIRFGVAVDGLFGPQTLQAVKLACEAHRRQLFEAWRARLAKHYVGLVLQDRAQVAFLDGWLRRAVASLAAIVLFGALSGPPVLAQQDTLERMEEDFLKLSAPCDALPAEERTIGGTDYRLRVYRCGHRLWRLWEYRCPEGYWSRAFLLDQADQYEDSYYLDRFAGLHNGRPGMLVEATRPACGA